MSPCAVVVVAGDVIIRVKEPHNPAGWTECTKQGVTFWWKHATVSGPVNDPYTVVIRPDHTSR